MPSPSTTFSQIPASFTAHKNRILTSLAVPEASYSDLSPKGSIDAPIRDLINQINALDGVVTTSSCSGRVAVFVQGGKDAHYAETGDAEVRMNPGGKGFSGRWLYVSHDPLVLETALPGNEGDSGSVSGAKSIPARVRIPDELLPLLEPSTGQAAQGLSFLEDTSSQPRLINLTFEPAILHISCATLSHAKPLLALALNAGFRESGLQSLKCLDHADTWPMVAIRSAGLAFSTVVGFVGLDGREKGLVDKHGLGFLLTVANERFRENASRVGRFRNGIEALLDQQRDGLGGTKNGENRWEDKGVRAARKRAEGLRMREEHRYQQHDGRSEMTRQDDAETFELLTGLETE